MTRFLLRVEGVNFDAIIDDTNDLSTIRGASLTLLRLHQAVEAALGDMGIDCERVFTGASQCAFTFECGADDGVERQVIEAVKTALTAPGNDGAPYPQVMTVADIVRMDEAFPAHALKQAEARNHSRQYREWTVTGLSPKSKASDADELNRIRPATVFVRRPAGNVLPLDSDDRDSGKGILLSPSVEQRRKYGRRARQQFYCDEIDDPAVRTRLDILSFTNTIEDMVNGPPDGLPVSVRGKIAVVYADGNGFGKIREAVGITKFSDSLAAYRRTLLTGIVGWLARGQDGQGGTNPQHPVPWQAFAIRDGNDIGLRFETLLWGGDEFIFVMPAWLAFAFARGFCAATADWAIDGHTLTHAMGVAIAHYKTPIRQLKMVAKKAADLAKDADLKDRTTVTFDIYESLAPPDVDLAAARSRLYGTGRTDDDPAALARLLAIPGDDFGSLANAMFWLTGCDGAEPFPRSQIYAALRTVREKGAGLLSPEADDIVAEHLKAYARRGVGPQQIGHLEANPLPACDGKRRPAALDFALTSQFWDYAHPFGTRMAGFGEASA